MSDDSARAESGRATKQVEKKPLKYGVEPLKTLAIADACDRLAATIRYDDEKDLSKGDVIDVINAESGESEGFAEVEHTETVPVRRALDVVHDWWAEYGIDRAPELNARLNVYYDNQIYPNTEVKVVIQNPDLDGEWRRST